MPNSNNYRGTTRPIEPVKRQPRKKPMSRETRRRQRPSDYLAREAKKYKRERNKIILKLIGYAIAIIGVPVLLLSALFKGNRNSKTESIAQPAIAQPVKETKPIVVGYKNHTISYGETITSIANKYNVTKKEILESNPSIQDENTIYAGDTIRIPIYGNEESYVEEPSVSSNYIRGIDISEYQGSIDWDKLEESYKRGDFSYIILRICENIKENQERGFRLDRRFEEYLSECNKRNIPYGFYAFSRGTNDEELNKEVTELDYYIRYRLTGPQEDGTDLTYNPSLPIIYGDFFDDPKGAQYNVYVKGKYDECVGIMTTWCKKMEDAGYTPGIYINNAQLGVIRSNSTSSSELDNYQLWVAAYPSETSSYITEFTDPTVSFDGGIYSQQISSTGIVDGIKGNVDINVSKEDIMHKGLGRSNNQGPVRIRKKGKQ